MLSAQRTKHLMGMLQREHSLSVAGAAERLGVSHSTIRRDFEQLERLGLVSRVYGGAVAADESTATVLESPRMARSEEHADEKSRIGRVAAGLISEGETVLISGGTTTDAMLKPLAAIRRVTVVTNNVQTALTLVQHSSAEVIVLGGYIRRDEFSLLGHLVTESLKHLTIDRAFFSAYAVGLTGLMGAHVTETETDRALIAAARQLVVLADHSKFHRTAPARLAPVSAIHTLVTDSGAPESVLAALTAQNVNVLTC